MTTEVITDASVVFDSQDLSAYVTAVTLNYEAEAQDDTAMGDDTRSMLGGLKNWSAEVEFNQDWADNLLDEIMFSRVGTIATLTIKKSSGSTGPSNPAYSGTALLQSYPPFGNTIGEKMVTRATFLPGGASNTLARAVA